MSKCPIEYYHQKLLGNKLALQYLYSRGIVMSTIKHFKLGLAGTVKEEFKASRDGINIDMGKSRKYPFFTNRIMIPINQNIQKPSFTSRDLLSVEDKYLDKMQKLDKIKSERETRESLLKGEFKENPKYKHSFHYLKGRELYRYEDINYWSDVDTKLLYSPQTAILVEGHFNVISMKQELARNRISDLFICLGLGGADLTEEHIKLLKAKGIQSVILMFDGDKAGRNGAFKASLKLIRHGINFSISIMEDGKDVNDVLVMDRKEFINNTIYNSSKGATLNPLMFMAKYIHELDISPLDLARLDKLYRESDSMITRHGDRGEREFRIISDSKEELIDEVKKVIKYCDKSILSEVSKFTVFRPYLPTVNLYSLNDDNRMILTIFRMFFDAIKNNNNRKY
jgi:hypothetical protein